MRQNQTRVAVNLNSWKEIAAYFDRGIRTVQRWERQLGLPVHRIGKGPRGPVYATTKELNFWLATSGALREAKPRLQLVELQPRGGKAAEPREKSAQSRRDAVEESHRLLKDVHALAQTIAETSARQRKQAEILQKRILDMQSRFKK